MKDAVNYLLPVVQDPMNELTGRCLSHHVSHNGYYGYQPVAAKGTGVDKEEKMETAPVTTDDMDIQFNNLMEPDDDAPPQQPPQPSSQNRKRMWMFDADVPNCKKRREIDSLPYTAERPCNDHNSNGNRHTHVRQPTHNVPDMPRCMMGAKPDDALLEELLRETHGGSPYHWLGHEI